MKSPEDLTSRTESIASLSVVTSLSLDYRTASSRMLMLATRKMTQLNERATGIRNPAVDFLVKSHESLNVLFLRTGRERLGSRRL